MHLIPSYMTFFDRCTIHFTFKNAAFEWQPTAQCWMLNDSLTNDKRKICTLFVKTIFTNTSTNINNMFSEVGTVSVAVILVFVTLFRVTEGWTLVPPTSLSFPTSFSTLAQFRNLLQSHPCWRIFSVVEPTIWHLGDSPKYEWPIHRAQWSRLAMAPSSPPSSILKTIFNAAVLALFPEINKRGTRSCPWNPRSIKPLWDASTWHKQSDLMTMGKSYSALWDLGDTIALHFQSTH